MPGHKQSPLIYKNTLPIEKDNRSEKLTLDNSIFVQT